MRYFKALPVEGDSDGCDVLSVCRHEMADAWNDLGLNLGPASLRQACPPSPSSLVRARLQPAFQPILPKLSEQPGKGLHKMFMIFNVSSSNCYYKDASRNSISLSSEAKAGLVKCVGECMEQLKRRHPGVFFSKTEAQVDDSFVVFYSFEAIFIFTVGTCCCLMPFIHYYPGFHRS